MPTVILQFVFLLIALDIRHVFGQSCTNLANPAHGRVRLRARGRIAKFRCYREFKLFGGKLIICSGNKWSLPPPVCIRNGCDEIQSSENLTVTKDQGGAVLEFKCAPPLKLIGKKLITCDGTAWSAPVPLCKYVEPGNYCDFEDENICGWQHDELAHFEWKWNYGTTPSRRTGPTYDHTLGKGGNGHYMFMESSSPIKRNDKARLLSPYFPATTGNLCFEIWYHMWSATGYGQVGRLKIYIEDMAQTDMLSQTSKLEVSGNQGDEWIKGQFPVGERKTSFRFIIEGTKLESYLSDIAVDDPKLYNCSNDYTDSTLRYRETTAIDTTESAVQTTTMNRRPIELTETPLRSAIVKTTEQLTASYKDYTESTLRYRETTAIDTTESAVQTTTMNRRPIETTETPLGSAIITQLIQTTTELDSPKDFTNSTLSYQETSKIDATWTVLNTLQIMVTPTHPRPVRADKVSLSSEVGTELGKTSDELSASLTNDITTDYLEKTTERLTVNNTQSTKASSITSETRKHTSPIVTVETTDYQTNRVPDNQSAIVLSSAQMATLEITKPRMFIKRITDVTNTSRETTKLKPIPKLVMSIKASTSTTATTNNITTTGKRKTTMNHKPATFANGIGHKLKFTNDVKTTRPNTTSTQVPSNRTFIGLNTQDVSFSNKKLGIYFEDTSYSSVKYLTSTEGSIEIAIVESYDTVTLLVIGLGVGIVIALMIMIVAIYAKHKKRRKEYTLWDREEPIVKNDSIEMDNCGKDSDVDYHFET